MTDAKDTGSKDAGKKDAGGPAPRTLSLKKPMETGQVRQSFSHGRSKPVLVEKKRTFTIVKEGAARPGLTPAAAPSPAPAPAPAPVAAKPAAAPSEAPRIVPAQPPQPAAQPAVAPVTEKAPAEPIAAKPAEPVKDVTPEPVIAKAPEPAPVVKPAPKVEAPPPAPPVAKGTPVPDRPSDRPQQAGRPAPGNQPQGNQAQNNQRGGPQGQGGSGQRPAPSRARSAMVLPTLTEEEKAARTKALADNRVYEIEARKRAEIEAKRRAEETARLTAEREAAAKRLAEEEARKRSDEEARKKSEDEAARRLADEEKKRPPAPIGGAAMTAAAIPQEEDEEERARKRRGLTTAKPLAPRRGEPKRRTGRLTLTTALDEEERQRSLASMRRQRERERRMGMTQERTKIARDVVVPDAITVQELANRMAERAADVIRTLMGIGVMATINEVIDADTAQLVVEEMGHTVKRVSDADVEVGVKGAADVEEHLEPRAPVVTIMGHVDHGKTSLLDAIRKTNVTSGEAGGITQHIGAYNVKLPTGGSVTFLDTPGHEAFTAMRARGAKVTDIVILVVAADDGVKPQTVEALSHAMAAKVPIIVAINKIDKPGGNPNRVRQELLQHSLVTEEMGGDVLSVEVSALKGTNLDKLLETVMLQAEVLELRANPNRAAEGVIVEAKLDRGKGPVATVLVQRGTLRVGDIVVAGAEYGRVRALTDDAGKMVKSAGPSIPVEVLGLQGVPGAGDEFSVVPDEARAREIVEYRQAKKREASTTVLSRGTLDQMLSRMKDNTEIKELCVVVKADMQGSTEAIVTALNRLSTDEVRVRILHAGVGGITESDVTLARASDAFIIGFNVRPSRQARDLAQSSGVDIQYHSIIYALVDEVRQSMTGMLTPERRENFIGTAEIRQVFQITKTGKVAGCRVLDGVVKRGAGVRIIRDNVVIHEGTLSSLRHIKDEVKEIRSGMECGMAFDNFQDLAVGDTIECFEVEEIARTL
jgi:translation initiation factor IF-2